MESLLYENNLSIPENISAATTEELETCPICNRKFIPDTYVKHVGICEKMAFKKRKPFDSFRQRREGTDLANYLPPPPPPPSQNPNNFSHHNSVKGDLKSLIYNKPTVPARRQSEPIRSTAAKYNYESTPLVTRSVKRNITAPPASEQCPFCERSFGLKAYDRHVEWCKEKAKLQYHGQPASVNAAKERLEARTKYKAPNLRSKREQNRDKYSGSTNSLSDYCGSSVGRLSNRNSEERERKHSMTPSMTSSITSDGGYSDKYDPFQSAKRQLEELFLPSQMKTSTPTPLAKKSSPQFQPTKSSLMSTSLTLKSPINYSHTNSRLTNANNTANNSNFRRTSSLRISSKQKPVQKSLIYTPSTYKPSTIQRGISDEGPISTNFLKPEEYDELPVKSHAVITPDLLPRLNSSSRESSQPPQSPLLSPLSPKQLQPLFNQNNNNNVVRRDSNSNINRRNLRLELKQQAGSPSDYPLSKTDSLAIFLKHENDSCTPPILSEKERKDKSNSLLNRQTSLNKSYDRSSSERSSVSPERALLTPHKYNSIKLAPLHKPPQLVDRYELSAISAPQQQTYNNAHESDSPHIIDPKLINICDNLPIISKMTESISSPDDGGGGISVCGDEDNSRSDQINDKHDSNKLVSQRNSGEVRRNFKRTLKLNKENFLYDITPSREDATDGNKMKFQNEDNNGNINKMFDDFDFEEFISSFEDDEQFPIFKGYKDLMSSRQSMGKSNKSEMTNSDGGSCSSGSEVDGSSCESSLTEKLENISVKDEKISYQELPIGAPEKFAGKCYQNNNNNITQAEEDLMKSVRELDRMCSATTPITADSTSAMMSIESGDECSSWDSNYPSRSNVGSKFSVDSAYSSISRQSPLLERPKRYHSATYSSNKTNSNEFGSEQIKQRQKSYQLADLSPSATRQQTAHNLSATSHHDQKQQPKISNTTARSSRASPPSSLSSNSGSESSLPPIMSQKELQQMNLSSNNAVAEQRFSKFCHSCGAKFTISLAKFCMDCGAKRIVLA